MSSSAGSNPITSFFFIGSDFCWTGDLLDVYTHHFVVVFTLNSRRFPTIFRPNLTQNDLFCGYESPNSGTLTLRLHSEKATLYSPVTVFLSNKGSKWHFGGPKFRFFFRCF